MKKRDKQILKDIGEGNWRKVLPRPLYQQVSGWLSQRKSDTAVIRFVFMESVRKKRFATHIVCSTKLDSAIRIKNIHVTPLNLWDSNPELLLAVPEELYGIPIFNMPHDTIKRARRKFDRQKQDRSERPNE